MNRMLIFIGHSLNYACATQMPCSIGIIIDIDVSDPSRLGDATLIN